MLPELLFAFSIIPGTHMRWQRPVGPFRQLDVRCQLPVCRDPHRACPILEIFRANLARNHTDNLSEMVSLLLIVFFTYLFLERERQTYKLPADHHASL